MRLLFLRLLLPDRLPPFCIDVVSVTFAQRRRELDWEGSDREGHGISSAWLRAKHPHACLGLPRRKRAANCPRRACDTRFTFFTGFAFLCLLFTLRPSFTLCSGGARGTGRTLRTGRTGGPCGSRRPVFAGLPPQRLQDLWADLLGRGDQNFAAANAPPVIANTNTSVIATFAKVRRLRTREASVPPSGIA